MLRIAQGRLALSEGDAARAVAYARDAIDALGDYHGGEQGEAVWTLAKGLAATRELVGAADAYTRAIDLLALNGRPNEAAEACVEWAELLTAAGRETEADDALRRAGNLRDQRTNRARQPHTR